MGANAMTPPVVRCQIVAEMADGSALIIELQPDPPGPRHTTYDPDRHVTLRMERVYDEPDSPWRPFEVGRLLGEIFTARGRVRRSAFVGAPDGPRMISEVATAILDRVAGPPRPS